MTHRCNLTTRHTAVRRRYGFHAAYGYLTLLATLAAPVATSGQIPPRAARSRAMEALLFMAPVPENRAADSTYSIELASRIRDRFGGLMAVDIAGEEYSELVDGVAGGLREYQSLIPQFSEALECDAAQPHSIPPQI